MNEGEFGGKITLVRVGGQGGNDTGDECGHFGENRLIQANEPNRSQTDRCRKTKRQTDSKRKGKG